MSLNINTVLKNEECVVTTLFTQTISHSKTLKPNLEEMSKLFHTVKKIGFTSIQDYFSS